MKKIDDKWMNGLLILSVLVCLMALAISIANKFGINGEEILVEAKDFEIEIEEPVAATATPIASKPIYVCPQCFECPEVIEEEYPTRDEVYCLSRLVHGEASVCNDLVKSQVAWCVINRVEAENYPNTIREVCSEHGQFAGWNRECSTSPSIEEREMCYDIILAWKRGDDSKRTLPEEYLYFMGDGEENFFTTCFYGNLKKAKKNAWKGER